MVPLPVSKCRLETQPRDPCSLSHQSSEGVGKCRRLRQTAEQVLKIEIKLLLEIHGEFSTHKSLIIICQE